jgi:hypothetical protein
MPFSGRPVIAEPEKIASEATVAALKAVCYW